MVTPDAVLIAAIETINLEGDLLDQGEFNAWLELWQRDGLYIVPIDPQETDFKTPSTMPATITKCASVR
ncbi:hypothetical protein OFY05_01495 [Pseudocitrobacter faecalis]|nr:hypothetical protein OFY05_01495 [Pseudocitrobacter faecalis]